MKCLPPLRRKIATVSTLRAKRLPSLAARLPLGKQQLAVNLLPGSLYNHPDAVGWLMDNLLAAVSGQNRS
ncbi:hypothetical protein LNO36_14220 [Klebsiella variicola subsp. variicola]|nr:hypothetical protein [Klebsiella variicola subsp. variicola]